MSERQSGKGSSRRPAAVSADELAARWQATFGTHRTIVEPARFSASARPDVDAIDARLGQQLAQHVNFEGME